MRLFLHKPQKNNNKTAALSVPIQIKVLTSVIYYKFILYRQTNTTKYVNK